MSTFLAIMSLVITLGMIFTVLVCAQKVERRCLQLSIEELQAIVEKLPEGAVINITIGGISV